MATRRAVPATTGPPVPHRRQWTGKGGKWSMRGKEARRSDREARRRWRDRRSEATHGGEDGAKPGRASGNREGIGGGKSSTRPRRNREGARGGNGWSRVGRAGGKLRSMWGRALRCGLLNWLYSAWSKQCSIVSSEREGKGAATSFMLCMRGTGHKHPLKSWMRDRI